MKSRRRHAASAATRRGAAERSGSAPGFAQSTVTLTAGKSYFAALATKKKKNG